MDVAVELRCYTGCVCRRRREALSSISARALPASRSAASVTLPEFTSIRVCIQRHWWFTIARFTDSGLGTGERIHWPAQLLQPSTAHRSTLAACMWHAGAMGGGGGGRGAAHLVKHFVSSLCEDREVRLVDVRLVERLPGAPPVLILHPRHVHRGGRVREGAVVVQKHAPDVVEVRVGHEHVRDRLPRDALRLQGSEDAAEARPELEVGPVAGVEEDAVAGAVLEVQHVVTEHDDVGGEVLLLERPLCELGLQPVAASVSSKVSSWVLRCRLSEAQTIVLISMHMRTFGAHSLISQPDKSDALHPVPYSDYLLK